jgi:TrmH RNA methyltransferase
MKPQRPFAKAKPKANPSANSYRDNESKLYGVNAALATFQNRAPDIIKVYLTKERLKTFQKLIDWCVKNRKAYKLVADDDLERLTESVHHEGICLIVKNEKSISVEDALRDLKKNPRAIFYLDGVQNPHNVGNILRLSAHFGVPYLFAGDAKNLSPLPPSARRVSEGGSEFARLIVVKDAERILKDLKAMGYKIFSTSSHAAKNVFEAQLPEKSVLILGSETHGVGQHVQKLAEQNLLIPGTDHVESLNVASAAAIFAAEMWRRFPLKTRS